MLDTHEDLQIEIIFINTTCAIYFAKAKEIIRLCCYKTVFKKNYQNAFERFLIHNDGEDLHYGYVQELRKSGTRPSGHAPY